MHGPDKSTFAYGMWTVMAFNVLLFVFFAMRLSYLSNGSPGFGSGLSSPLLTDSGTEKA
jgi:hypothetical protein